MDIETFKQELTRCLGCKVMPCAKACPLGVSPHDFIAAAKNGRYAEAAALIAAKNPLPQTCGLVCPDLFCQKACIRRRIDSAVAIPCLQAEIIQKGGLPPLTLPKSPTISNASARGKFCERATDVPQRRGAYIDVRDPTDVGLPSVSHFTKFPRAVIIGGGPSGLGAVFTLITHGWQVDLYEKAPTLGGAARLIPEYRLPQSVLDAEIARLIKNDRVTLHLNTEVTDFAALKKQYDGVILALGEPNFRTLGIKGEEHSISYIEFLSHPEKYKAEKIAVCGGGEVALDCALTAARQNAAVEMFVRRRREDMRIMPRDQKALDTQGITVRALTSVTEIRKESSLCCLTTVNNEINAEGKAVHCPDSACELSGYNLVIQALGSYFPKENIPEGFITAGDMTGTGGTVVTALASGISAARRLLALTGDAQ